MHHSEIDSIACTVSLGHSIVTIPAGTERELDFHSEIDSKACTVSLGHYIVTLPAGTKR